MSNDPGMKDRQPTGMLNNTDPFNIQDFGDDNYGLNNISTASRPNSVGSRPLNTPSIWTQSSILGASDTLGDKEVQAPRSFGLDGSTSSTLSIAFDDAEYTAFGNSSFFDLQTAFTNDSFQPDGTQDFSSINPQVRTIRSDSTASVCVIPQNFDPSALKKRKTITMTESKEPPKDVRVFDGFTVLNLLFKYTEDLTATQMENIAEDIDYAPEFVAESYMRYRRAVKSGSLFLDHTPSTDRSAFALLKQPNGNMQVHLANGRQNENSMANNDASKDIRREERQDENAVGKLEHAAQDKPFQCPDCDMKFSRQAEMKRHAKKHRQPDLPCTFPSCKEVFYRKDKLRQHWERKHKNSSLPSNLGSSKPGKDPDQDGNSRSNGFSKFNGSRSEGQSSGRASESSKPYNSSSSGRGCASDDHDGSSRGNSKSSDADLDHYTESSESDAVQSDVDTRSDSSSDTDRLDISSNQNIYQSVSDSQKGALEFSLVQPMTSSVEGEDNRPRMLSSSSAMPAQSSKPTSASNRLRDILGKERASVTRLEKLESHVFKRDARLDLEVQTAFCEIKELWRSVATLRGQARSQNNRINSLVDANQAIQGDLQALQNPVIAINNAFGVKSSTKSQSTDEGNVSGSWTAHVSLLPCTSQPFPFDKDSSAYKRALSRGLHRTITIPGPESRSFTKAISSEFAPFLKGGCWMPLMAKIREAENLLTLRQLLPAQLTERLYDLEFLKRNCAILDKDGNILNLYIAMQYKDFSWAQLRRLPLVIGGLEASWEYDPLLDGPCDPDYQLKQDNTTSAWKTDLALMPPRITGPGPLIRQSDSGTALTGNRKRSGYSDKTSSKHRESYRSVSSAYLDSKVSHATISRGSVDVINQSKRREDRLEVRSSDAKSSEYHKSSSSKKHRK